MKKFITLLIAVGAFVATYAQNSRVESRRVILGQPAQRTVIVRRTNVRAYPAYRPVRVYHVPPRRRYVHYYRVRHDNGWHKGWYKGRGNRRHWH